MSYLRLLHLNCGSGKPAPNAKEESGPGNTYENSSAGSSARSAFLQGVGNRNAQLTGKITF
jgi:hypothetical protein